MPHLGWLRALASRSLWLGAGALLLLLLLAWGLYSQRHWQQRAASLERENAGLQLRELSRAIDALSKELLGRAAEMADSAPIAQMLLNDSASAADRTALIDLARQTVDELLLVSASHSVRSSATFAGNQFTERPVDPALMHFLASALAAPHVFQESSSHSPFVGFVGEQWAVATPVVAHGSSRGLLGWLVVTRTVSTSVLAQLAQSVRGPLTAHPLRQWQASSLPAEVREWIKPAGTAAFTVTAHAADGDVAGYAVLRDGFGAPVWVFKLGLDSRSLPMYAQAPSAGRGAWAYASGPLSALLLVVLGAMVFRRYVHSHKSVAARYKAIIDHSHDGIVLVDAKTDKIVYANPAFAKRLGYTNEEAQGLTLPDIFVDGEAAPHIVLARLHDLQSQAPIYMQQRAKAGDLLDIELRCNSLDVDGRAVLAFVTHDVSLRRKAEQQLLENQHRLDRMAHHDQLTGLPNRHYLSTYLPCAILEAQAAQSMLGVVFLDLDRFKHINDTRGHETGDKLLQEVAKRLQACVRESDVVIRMGGDEFVVVFRNVKSYDEVTFGAGRIIETLNKPIVIDRHSLQTTGSVGVSMFPRDGTDMIELLKHSDTAMYQAKDRGRNNVQMFSQIMNRKLKTRVAVEASLREALRLKQLDVHYQPFVNLHTRKVVGLEALMRWQHPVHGMVPNDQFIPVAEETGLIVPMGNFVLHRTLQTMSAWRKAGVPLVPVALNIAPAQLQRGDLQSTIATLLKTHGLRPELLQLEMTERAIFDSHAPAAENRQDTIARLRDMGIKIAIDDFGTGYSSLSYLKNWRVDALKIDRSFVRDLVTDSSDLAIVSAIIAIARHLNIEVIAEGIEAYQQAEILRRLGCAVGQGYLFAEPMGAEQCLQYLCANAMPENTEDEDMLAVFSAGRG